MKKLFVFLLALTVIGTTVFAQDAKKASPEAKYGFSGSFEMDLVKGAKSDTFDGSYQDKDVVAKDNPQGLKVTAFNVNPWLSLDWSKVSFKAEAKYNGFDADDEDFSSLKLTTIIKDLYGFEIKSEVAADNKRTAQTNYKANPAENPPDVTLGDLSHDLFVTYKTEGHTFYTKYGFSTLTTGNDSVLDPLEYVGSFLDLWKEIGWTMDTEGLGAKLVIANDGAAKATRDSIVGAGVGAPVDARNFVKDAWIEARNMFGMWTSLVNGGEIKLRQANLDLDVSEDRDDVSNEFAIDREFAIYALWKTTDDGGDAVDPVADPILDSERGTNWLNTVKINDALTAKVGMVVPYAAVSFVDWLKGENLVAGVDYTLAGVGKLGAGALVSMDYDTLLSDAAFVAGGSNDFIEGKSKALSAYLTSSTDPMWDSGLWFDATVTEAVPGLKLFASADVRFGTYLDNKKITADTTAGKGSAADNLLTITTASMSMMNLGLEAAYTVMDPLTVSAAFYTGVVSGLEYETAVGVKFVKPASMSGSWSEEDWARATSEVKPMIIKVRADYKVNDTVSVWASNAFTANAHYFDNGDLDGDATLNFADAAVKPVYGYFSKNTIGAGAKLAASKNASLKIGAEFNMYTAPDLSFVDGATADQKTVAEKDYEIFKAANLDPFKVTAAFSYTY